MKTPRERLHALVMKYGAAWPPGKQWEAVNEFEAIMKDTRQETIEALVMQYRTACERAVYFS